MRAAQALLPVALLCSALLPGCENGAAKDTHRGPAQARPELPFDAARAWKDLERIVGFGPRPAGSPALDELRTFLEAELRTLGLEPERQAFEAETPLGTRAMCNLIADIPGGGGPDTPIVLLCTHIDTKVFGFEFVGANDGGSGTAVLLELARALAPTAPHAVTYRLIFLDGEEALRPQWRGQDNTYGSRYYADRLLRSADLERVKACVLLDMVGDKDLRLTRDTNSDRELMDLFTRAARRAGLEAHTGAMAQPIKDDHLPFMRVGIPSCDLIDLEFGPGNSFWHTAADTLENCSQASLEAIGRIVLTGLPDLEAWALKRR